MSKVFTEKPHRCAPSHGAPEHAAHLRSHEFARSSPNRLTIRSSVSVEHIVFASHRPYSYSQQMVQKTTTADRLQFRHCRANGLTSSAENNFYKAENRFAAVRKKHGSGIGGPIQLVQHNVSGAKHGNVAPDYQSIYRSWPYIYFGTTTQLYRARGQNVLARQISPAA